MSVASSADGTKLVAVVQNGQIYTSTDSGFTWTPRDSDRNWKSVASSSDGTKLVAGVDGGPIYTFPGPTSLGPGGYLTGDSDAAIELQFIGSGPLPRAQHVRERRVAVNLSRAGTPPSAPGPSP